MLAIKPDDLSCHCLYPETALENPTDRSGIEPSNFVQSLHCLLRTIDDDPGDTVFDNLAHASLVPGYDRYPACHRLDHHETERFGPIDRKDQGDCAREEGLLLCIGQAADVPDAIIQPGPHDRVEVGRIPRIYRTRQLQWQSSRLREFYRPIRPLLVGHATDEG